MEVTVWYDHVCPWAYAGRSRTKLLQDRGLVVVSRAFELHPELPPEGRPVRAGSRLDRVLDHIADECAAAGLPFTKPTRSPNTRSVLLVAEVVRAHTPHAFAAVDAALARAQWVEGRPIDDPAEVAAILTASGVDPSAVEERIASGEGDQLLDESMRAAREVGVTGTPAWRIGELTIPGLQPTAQFERWVDRLLGRRNGP
jgi:predicted DsbA family dithiol-disulfide isomerase